MKQNFKLFFDMDDTLAKFASNEHQDDINSYLNTRGTFEFLEPLNLLYEVNHLAAIFPENVFICSACVDTEFCEDEKIRWLRKNLPLAMKENVIFTRVGESKVEAVYKQKGIKVDKYCVLIDDYSKNIEEWESCGGTAIKFKNSFNTKNPNKYKYIVSNLIELFKTLEIIRNSDN